MQRFRGAKPPWTNDQILMDHKFTNVYRFLDFESQFLIRHVIKAEGNFDPLDRLFRVLLFKTFNLSTTWIYLEDKLGVITRSTATKDILIELLNQYVKEGGKVFSSAYLQASNFVQKQEYKYLVGRPKHEQYLTVWGEHILFNDLVLQELLESKDLESLCLRLQDIPGVGRFMSYQFAQDLNYTNLLNHDMSKHVEEGPGSIRGIHRMFDIDGSVDYKEILKWTHENIYELFDIYGLGGQFEEFKEKPIGLEDIQNCFCETDKYMRGIKTSEGKRIKQKYKHGNSREVTAELPE